MEHSVSFYQKLDFAVTWRGTNFTTLGPANMSAPAFVLNLFHSDSYRQPATGEWNGWGRSILYVKSKRDVDAMYVTAVGRGLKPEHAPRDADWGERYFQILDPMGHELAIAFPLPAELPSGAARAGPPRWRTDHGLDAVPSGTQPRCGQIESRKPRVVVVYYSLSGHTRALAEAIRGGANSSRADVRLLSVADADVEKDILDWCDAVVIGAPVHYGNVAAGLLQWAEEAWGAYWEDARFATKVGAVFATGGGMAQGLEHAITGLHRLLMSFRVALIVPPPQGSPYNSYGAVAVTGPGPFHVNGSALIAEPFADAGRALGRQVALEVSRRLRDICV